MKKTLRKIALLSFSLTALGAFTSQACTNFMITKGASKDGSTMITYAADAHVLYGELYYRPAATYPAGTMMDVINWDSGRKMGEISQAPQTYSVVGNMNEFQLAISETTFGGLSYLEDTTGIIDYGSLIYITLQRAKTAREAIQVMSDLVSTYGYGSSGESLSISDPNEVWVFEIIGKGKPILDKNGNIDPKKYSKGAVWVAYRIPDGCISGHANQARITKVLKADGKKSITSKDLKKLNLPGIECVYAYDVVDYATNLGLFNGKFEEFSFSDIYAPLDFSGARGCEARVWSGFLKANKAEMAKYEAYARGEDLSMRMPLWITPDRKLSVEDVMDMMRDHYEGTSMDMTKDVGAGPYECPYRWRPMGFEVDGKKYVHERAISTQQTGFSFIAQSRSWLPNPIGGILWFGVDDTYSTCYVPMYCGITTIPECFRVGNGNMLTYSPTSAFWLFNQVTNFAYLRYNDMIKDVQKVQNELESSFIKKIAANDAKWGKETDMSKLVGQANAFSNEQANITFASWKKLSEYLLIKYIDGNIKKEENGKFTTSPYGDHRMVMPSQPQYPDWWYKKIVEDAGENLKVVEPATK